MTIKLNELVPEVIVLDPKTYEINEQKVEVRQYLPVDEKLDLIGRIAMAAHDADYNFANPLKIEVYLDLFMILKYTNIEFPVNEINDLIDAPNVYDQLAASGLLTQILELIPEGERKTIEKYAKKTITSIYTYQNSAMGILSNISTEYQDMDQGIMELREKIATADLSTLKEIMTQLG